ncbi:50S ribosomal protein L3 [Patescibacteria group bacterium]|nr:50S ribosomal protein L3 [Patescibacteria group bacterium]MBU1922176.1 50S ribosomal protein L3 [Patescibacteria group bacterium]
MKFILGKKIEMGQIWDEKGVIKPVTWIKATPCQVVQVKTEKKDGYSAVQLGCGEKKKLNKPKGGHVKDLSKFEYLTEFRVSDPENYKRAQEINVSIFRPGEKVVVSGVSKGRGFQGVVKRHGFSGSPASHGHKDQLRMPGSIGATDPARVFPGARMPGHMGDQRVTVKNLEVIAVDEKENKIALKGAVPGSRHSLVEIKCE